MWGCFLPGGGRGWGGVFFSQASPAKRCQTSPYDGMEQHGTKRPHTRIQTRTHKHTHCFLLCAGVGSFLSSIPLSESGWRDEDGASHSPSARPETAALLSWQQQQSPAAAAAAVWPCNAQAKGSLIHARTHACKHTKEERKHVNTRSFATLSASHESVFLFLTWDCQELRLMSGFPRKLSHFF